MRGMTRTDPHISVVYSEHIALELGQQEPPDTWPIPEEQTGNTVVTTRISGGESFDPPLVEVHVYAGMTFLDTIEDRPVTFETATWAAWAEDGERDWTQPRNPVKTRFEEPEDPEDPDSPTLELSGDELATRIREGRYQNVTY